MNARIEGQYWTTGPYDGVLIIDAPDETTAAALVLRLGKDANVSTCMLRAFDAEEFASVLKKIGSGRRSAGGGMVTNVTAR